MKKLVYLLTPKPLRRHLDRIEASPLGYRMARGAFWAVGGAAISRGLMVLASIVAARILGKTAFGELGIIQSSVGMFSAFSGLGLGITATKYIAELRATAPARAERIIAISSSISIFTGAAVTLAMVAMAPYLADKALNAPHLSGLLTVSAPMLLFGTWSGAQNGILSGLEAFKTIARINLATGLLSFPFIIGGVLLGGLPGAVWGLTLSSAAGCAFNNLALRSELSARRLRPDYANCGSEISVIWKFSIPAALSTIIIGPINWAASAMLVNTSGGYGEMGVYNAANQWLMALMFLPSVAGSVVMPILSETLGRKDSHSTGKVLKFNLMASAAVGIPIGLLLCLLSPYIMGWYGPGFSGRWLTLALTIATAVILATETPVGHIIAASGKMWTGLAMNTVWGGAFIGLSYLLLSHGADGIAMSRLLAYVVHAIWTFVFAYDILRRTRSTQTECES